MDHIISPYLAVLLLVPCLPGSSNFPARPCAARGMSVSLAMQAGHHASSSFILSQHGLFVRIDFRVIVIRACSCAGTESPSIALFARNRKF